MKLIEDLDLFAKLLASVKVNGRVRALNPLEVANSIKRLMEEGDTIDTVSQRLSIKKDMIDQFLNLLKLPKEYQNIIIWGTSTDEGVSFSTGVRIARLEKQSDMKTLLGSSMEYKFTKKEIENIVSLKNSSSLAIEDCIEKVKAIRPVIETKYMYLIILTSETANKIIELAKNKGMEIKDFLKSRIENEIPSENILAVVMRGTKIVLSLNEKGYELFSTLLSKNKLTLGGSIQYFLREKKIESN